MLPKWLWLNHTNQHYYSFLASASISDDTFRSSLILTAKQASADWRRGNCLLAQTLASQIWCSRRQTFQYDLLVSAWINRSRHHNLWAAYETVLQTIAGMRDWAQTRVKHCLLMLKSAKINSTELHAMHLQILRRDHEQQFCFK